MKNPALSVWLSAANRAAGWWIGTATSIARRQQQLALAEMTKAATGRKPPRKRSTKPKRRT
ncbi:hypothetical protein GCM10007886_16650 [Methylobacterium gregans]|uniref:Uncharacterized protein n=1 Tax=Methylobacterium gregans TaxID=374424 RepID=A0AA37HKF4_9HYPH|nr:hypothetical protein [Methylobacterium gregans]MDQ0523297.1 hypothetical protein [Methylobacterium gregans]GJD77228.1 hypothetical protein NBEOAGPD_0431 [Methylobacterium gregans]GLS53482.1 hypothetical protein GCM10007886_16650 [Methylobacterium gregans]